MTRAILLFGMLAALCFASVLFGARAGITLGDLSAVLIPPSPGDAAAIVVHELRLPRTLGAMAAGGALGVAGALIQTLTRNPLADPGLLGVNAGAALGVVLAVWITGPLTAAELAVPAMLGGFAALMIVWGIGAGSRSPLTLILAGTALTALLSAVLRGLILMDRTTLEIYRDWSVGVLDLVDFSTLRVAFPLLVFGVALAVPAARRLDTLALGNDLASALGTNLLVGRILTLGAIGILSTAAVLIAGPLIFVGLVAPHIARALHVQNSRTLLLYSAVLGGALVLAADLAGRVIAPGIVIEAGLGVTLIGGVFLILVVRREGRNPA